MLAAQYKSEISPSSNLRRSIAFSKPFVQNFKTVGPELSHRGCVNTVKWNSQGNRIVTGSDDRLVKIWDTSKSMDDVKLLHEIRTSHSRNIFCAEMNPFNENIVISCAADGKINIHDINNKHAEVTLQTSSLMHMFIYDIENPMIAYTAEENGWISRLDIRTKNIETIFRNFKENRNQTWEPECVKAISQSVVHGASQMVVGGKGFEFGLIDLRNNYKDIHKTKLFSELYVKTWSPTYPTPSYYNGSSIVSTKLFQHENLSIFQNSEVISVSGLQISKDGSEILVSYQGDQIYKFPYNNPYGDDNIIGASSCLGGHINFSTFLKTVAYFGPQEEYVVAGSDSGHLWIWDSNEGNLAGLSKPSERSCSVVNFLKADEHCCNGVRYNMLT